MLAFMRKVLRLGLLLGLLAASRPAHADQDLAVWSGVVTTARVGAGPRPVLAWLDLHGRRDAPAAIGIVRPGIGIELAPWLSVFGGYAWVPSWPDASDARTDEHRTWEQAILTHALGEGATLMGRTRLEQRFHEAGDDVGHRVRQLVRFGWVPRGGRVGVVVWDEVFVALGDTDWGQRAGYDQNRLFAGAILTIAPWARVELGYLVAHLDREPDRWVHAFGTYLFFTPTLSTR